MIVKIPSVAKGAVPDAMPEELDLGAWSSVVNCVFRGGFMQRCEGNEAFVTTPTVTPHFLLPFRTGTQLGLIHVGLQKAFIDLAGTRTEIGRVAAYTGSAADRWTGGTLNGIAVINNGIDPPQYWAGNTAVKFADLTNWTASATCRALRPFKDVLVAMDLTLSGTRFPSRVRVSSIAAPGTLPASWDPADPTQDVRQFDVEGGDVLVDGLALGDQFILYKTSSTHAMRYVGGQNVWSRQRIPGGVGILGRNCVVDTAVGHVCLTTGDVVVHQGGTPRSIATDLVRDTLFNEMDPDYYDRAFVTADPSRSEVWVCYPTGGPTCNRAAIWNWRTSLWTFRTLRNVIHGAHGQMPAPVGLVWDDATMVWDDANFVWGGAGSNPSDQKLALAHALPAISLVGYGSTDVGQAMTAEAIRTGIALDDAQRVKLLKRIWPIVDAAVGTQILITMGSQQVPDGPVTWGTERTFTVGTDRKVDDFAQGPLLAIRWRTTANAPWRTRSMSLNVEPRGMF